MALALACSCIILVDIACFTVSAVIPIIVLTVFTQRICAGLTSFGYRIVVGSMVAHSVEAVVVSEIVNEISVAVVAMVETLVAESAAVVALDTIFQVIALIISRRTQVHLIVTVVFNVPLLELPDGSASDQVDMRVTQTVRIPLVVRHVGAEGPGGVQVRSEGRRICAPEGNALELYQFVQDSLFGRPRVEPPDPRFSREVGQGRVCARKVPKEVHVPFEFDLRVLVQSVQASRVYLVVHNHVEVFIALGQAESQPVPAHFYLAF